MKVTPVRFTNDLVAMRRFLVALGLTSTLSSDSGNWMSLEGSGGEVGLHSVDSAANPQKAGSTGLSFTTDEPLETVARRLDAAGFPAVVVDEAFGRVLQVTDPDGQEIEVHATMTDLHGYSEGG
ncbi:VOC family protein [Kineococcus sp. NPDC059986]|uniref:VOC family protein n=1 Tax=Kineococcus sp. NPDC059986 TaxID=3155538 RepID=UPI00344EFECC